MSNMRIPGPTPYYPGVYKGLQKEMISHRSSTYQKLHASVIEKLTPFFGTKKHIYILTSSGTGGMEAGICNLFNPGDSIISFCIGVFGERWIKIAKAFGTHVVEERFPMGSPVDLARVEVVLKKHKKIKGVLITHNETSTGVLNPLEAFTKLCKKYVPDAMVLVDSISVLGATKMNMDNWGIDFVTTSAQKAWSAPAGLCTVAISERAYKKMFETTNARFYFDLRLADKYAAKDQTPTTVAVGSLYGLDGALATMHKEGVAAIFSRHVALMRMLRTGLKKLGLQLVVDDKWASPTVTAVYTPDNVDTNAWRKTLSSVYDTQVAGGKGELEGKIIRIAHMGNVSKRDIQTTLKAIEKSLKQLKQTL